MACRNGHLAVVRCLIEDCGALYGARTDATEQRHVSWLFMPPIYGACIGMHADVVDYLITKQVDVNQPAIFPDKSSGSTPLIVSAALGHRLIVVLLVDDGKADPNLRDKKGMCPYAAAASNRHDKIAEFLLENSAEKVDVPQCSPPKAPQKGPSGPPPPLSPFSGGDSYKRDAFVRSQAPCKYSYWCTRKDCYYIHPLVCICGSKGTSWKNVKQHMMSKKW